MFKPLIDYTKELLGKKVETVSISTHLVQSPVVVLSADYGWTAQMEKVMKSQAFADQSKCAREAARPPLFLSVVVVLLLLVVIVLLLLLLLLLLVPSSSRALARFGAGLSL